MKPRTYIKLLILSALLPLNVLASTDVVNVDGGAVWDESGSPYVVSGSVTITAGDTLAIGPNTVIQFGPQGSLDVYGTLVADGALGIVRMTAAGDIPVAPDSLGLWAGITVYEGGSAELNNVAVEYAGKAGTAIVNRGLLNADNLRLSGYPGTGLSQKAGTTTLLNSRMTGGTICIEHDAGAVAVAESVLERCSYAGISSFYSGTVNLDRLHFIDIPRPVMAEASIQLSARDTRIESSVPGHWNGFVRFGDLTDEADWSSFDATPIIQFLIIEAGATLTVPAGTQMRFPQNENLLVRGTLALQGTADEPIVITSLRDDDYGEMLFDGQDTFPQPRDWGSVSVERSGSIDARNVIIRHGGKPGLYSSSFGGALMNMGGALTLESAELKRNDAYALYHDAGTTTIHASLIEDNAQGIRINSGNLLMSDSSLVRNVGGAIDGYSGSVADVRNNWWGSVTGPYDSDRNPSGQGERVMSSGDLLIEPWLSAPPAGEQDACCSSVLFIPGFQATRMEVEGGWLSDRLWEPHNLGDVEALNYDDAGMPVDPAAGPTAVIDEAFGFNIYKKFLDFMMTDLVDTDDISEFYAVPYDWRKSPAEIAMGETQILGGARFTLKEKVEELASQSKTGKVTIVAHSNGGLIAQLLMNHLVDTGEDELIDQIILVAVPQSGTPKAIAGLLHGDGQTIPEKFGILLDRKTARNLGYGIPGAYTLLPSAQYFADVMDPVVEFSDDVKNIYDFQATYGKSIDTLAELDNFLLGEGGARAKPASTDIDSPYVLKGNLLSAARDIQAGLSLWQAPSHVNVSQIVGWGLDTIRGIKYDDCDVPLCPQTLSHLDRELLLTIDGDKTVVTPSAARNSNSTYYVNLRGHNRELFSRLRRNRDHADILEAYPTQDMLKNLVLGKSDVLPRHVSTTTPEVSDSEELPPSLRVRVHSPVSLHVYDSEGNHTGLVDEGSSTEFRRYEEGIVNSYYWEIGHSTYVGIGEGSGTVKLVGTGEGTFTLEIDRVMGGEVAQTYEYLDVPVVVGAVASTSVSVNGVPLLAVDVDNDGTTDSVIAPGGGIRPDELIGILRGLVKSYGLPKAKQTRLLRALTLIEKTIEREFKKEERKKMVLSKQIKLLERTITRFGSRKILTAQEVKELQDVLQKIQTNA